MLSYRQAVLGQLFAERSEHRRIVVLLRDTIVEALQLKEDGQGNGPSHADCERLAAAMKAAAHAEDAYQRMLAHVASEAIVKAQRRTRSGH